MAPTTTRDAFDRRRVRARLAVATTNANPSTTQTRIWR
jgi:hypothetical protein